MYADVRASILLHECIHSKQSPPHLPGTVCLDCCDVSCSHLLRRGKQFQHSELRKEPASLAGVEMPFSTTLYLSTAHAPSADEIRKVGQWRAKEGCSTGMLRAGREADEGVVRKMGKTRAAHGRYQPRALRPGSRRPVIVV